MGGPLALEDVDAPDGDGVVDVRAAGINFADVLIRRGRYPQPPELPHVLGFEVAGELDGRRVLGFTERSHGGYAERVRLDPQWTFALPTDAGFAQGAAFLATYLTAYVPLVRQVRVDESSVVLVHAGSGGVGTAAIQLAKARGARVVATASSEEKRAFAREVGADEVRAYDELDDLAVDVVLDPVGGDVLAASLKILRPFGAVVAIGFAGGAWPPVDPAVLVGRSVGVHGVYLNRLLRLEQEFMRRCAEELLAAWAAGEIAPVVGATFALGEVEDAHALIEARRHVGKVVLEP